MQKIIDANKIVGDISYLFSEIASIYPITPSSPMAAEVESLASKGQPNLFGDKVNVIEMQSEAGASGTLHGALISGSLATTYTASQGLLLMIPNMYKIAGEMLPGVIHVASRTVATHGLSIFGDHSDIYAVRQTGFCMLSSNNTYEAQYMAAIAHLSAIKSSLPFLHFFDGFRTSHEMNKIDIIDEVELLKLVDRNKIKEFKEKSLNLDCGYQRGLAYNDDIYFQCVEGREKYYHDVVDIVNNYMSMLNEITKKDFKPFNYYGDSEATEIIIAMGSVVDTIKLVVDEINNQGGKVGVVGVHLYRPFSKEYLINVIPKSVNKIAVLDRTKEFGSNGEPLYLDVVNALKDTNIKIVGGRYGLSSKNTTPTDIYSVYCMLKNKLKDYFTIGINDDVTNSSLPIYEFNLNKKWDEVKIYGFGSDGMVSTSKSILSIIGNNSEKYVQGYFEYDSKKSGGVTVSHLRISNEEIHAPFYVDKASLIVVTKDNYFKMYSIVKDLKKNGILLINSSNKTLKNVFSKEDIELLRNNNIKIYVIDADDIALSCGIKGKISKIMEVIILKLLHVDNAQELCFNSLSNLLNKGEDVVKANKEAIMMALENIREVTTDLNSEFNNYHCQNVYEYIMHRKGYELSVSNLLGYEKGIFPGGLSVNDKRKTSNIVAKWNKDNCIECGFCSLVCPHAVIRPIIKKEPSDNSIVLMANKEYNYEIVVSESDCTSCGLCISVCPGKNGNKALSFGNYEIDKDNYAKECFNNHENDEILNKFNVIGSQLIKPGFCFSGACAGCGETPYIKLLTQLFKNEIVIANATGCSSIYGGSVPSTPYTIPWANSLFEDNAEFALGMDLSYKNIRNRIKNIMNSSRESVNSNVKELYDLYLNNEDNYAITMDVKNKLEKEEIPRDLREILNYVPSRTVWAIGGDGWAYDIGFGGLDHVLSSNCNVKVLVLDTEVYSNTGGQASKASRLGQVAEFSNLGKRTKKKDLFRIAMSYPNCYVGSICLGANYIQTIRTFKEAMDHKGPSIIIAYSPCVEQGIKGGMKNAINEERLSVNCGYNILMRYVPEEGKLYVDSREPDFNQYEAFLDNELRFRNLKMKDAELANELLGEEINAAKNRYNYYKEYEKNVVK